MAQSQIKTLTLMAMCFALFMTNTDDTILNVALAQIQTSLGADVSGLQWIINAYTLPAASLVLTSGTLGDIYGRKRVFLAGVGIFTIASMISGCAANLGILIMGRIVQGIGAAALIPTSLSIVTATFPESKQQTQAIAIWSAVSGLALIIGPVLGGLLVDIFGWQSTFFMNVPFGVMAWIITACFVKEGKKSDHQTIDIQGLILSIVFLASVTYTLIEADAGLWQTPLIIWSLIASGLSFLGFLTVELHSSHPMLPLKLFKNPMFVVVNIVQFLVLFTFISLLFIFSLFLQQVQGYSPVAAGLRFLPLNGSFVIGLLISGWIANKLGWRVTIIAGLLLASLTTISFIRLRSDTEYVMMLWPLIFSGFGGGLTIAPLAAAAMYSAPLTQAGIASAVLNTSNRLGGVLGIALQGTILTQTIIFHFQRSLSSWHLPATLQQQIITNALHNSNFTTTNLPANISPLTLHQAFSRAFVSGIHTNVLIATIALILGVLLMLLFVPSHFQERSHL